MALFGVLAAVSASAFNLTGPFITNVPPSNAIDAYLQGYREGYGLGYHWCGPCTFNYQGLFVEAFVRGQERGRINGWEDAEAEWHKQAENRDLERMRTKQLIWHAPMLPPSENAEGDAWHRPLQDFWPADIQHHE